MLRHVLAIILAGLAVRDVHGGGAQPPEGLSWRVSVKRSEPITTQDRTFRLYEEPNFLELDLTFVNAGQEPVDVDQRRFRAAIRFRVSHDRALAISSEWPSTIRSSALSSPIGLSDEGLVSLEGGEHVTWSIQLRRVDGSAFVRGVYRIDVDIAASAGVARRGIAEEPKLLRQTDLTLVVGAARTSRERAAKARATGDEALKDGRVQAASEAFAQALAEDPNDDSAKYSLAATYLAGKKYRQAVALYEDLLLRLGESRRRRAAPFLAQGYIGLGDEPSAIRVLNGIGLSGSELAAKLREIREIVRRR